MTAVADFVWQRLQEWGVRRVFGYPGDGIGGLFGALARTKGAIDIVQVRHEESPPSSRARSAVCLATSGPGAIHLLNGLYNAKLDHQPVLAIFGQQARTAIGSHYQQDLDLQSLFKDVAGAFVETAFIPAQVPHLIDRGYCIALSETALTPAKVVVEGKSCGSANCRDGTQHVWPLGCSSRPCSIVCGNKRISTSCDLGDRRSGPVQVASDAETGAARC